MSRSGANEERTGLLDLPPDIFQMICCKLLKRDLGPVAVSCKALTDIAQRELFRWIDIEDLDLNDSTWHLLDVELPTWRYVRHLSFSLSPFKEIDNHQEIDSEYSSESYENHKMDVIQAPQAWCDWLDLLQNVVNLEISLYPKGLQDITDPTARQQWMHCANFIGQCHLSWSSRVKVGLNVDLDSVDPTTPCPSVTWPILLQPFEGFDLTTTILGGCACCITWDCPLSAMPASTTRNITLFDVRGLDVLSLATTANLTSLHLRGVDLESIYEVLSRFSHTLIDLTLDDDFNEEEHDMQHLQLKSSHWPRIRMWKLARLWSSEVYLGTLSYILDAISLRRTCKVTVVGASSWHLVRTTKNPMVDLWLLAQSISRLDVAFDVRLRWWPASPCAPYAAQLSLLGDAIARTGGKMTVKLSHLDRPPKDGLQDYHPLDALGSLAQSGLLNHLSELSLALNEFEHPPGENDTRMPEPPQLSTIRRLSLSATDYSGSQAAANFDCIFTKIAFPALRSLVLWVTRTETTVFIELLERLQNRLSSFPTLETMHVRDMMDIKNPTRKPSLASLIIRQAALASLKRTCESMNIEFT